MVLKKPMGAGGKMRRFSSMQAFKYGSSVATGRLMSLADLNVVRISSLSFSRHRGFRKIRLVKDARELAVVSDPATLEEFSFVWTVPLARLT